jgi:hypothetical protein
LGTQEAVVAANRGCSPSSASLKRSAWTSGSGHERMIVNSGGNAPCQTAELGVGGTIPADASLVSWHTSPARSTFTGRGDLAALSPRDYGNGVAFSGHDRGSQADGEAGTLEPVDLDHDGNGTGLAGHAGSAIGVTDRLVSTVRWEPDHSSTVKSTGAGR